MPKTHIAADCATADCTCCKSNVQIKRANRHAKTSDTQTQTQTSITQNTARLEAVFSQRDRRKVSLTSSPTPPPHHFPVSASGFISSHHLVQHQSPATAKQSCSMMPKTPLDCDGKLQGQKLNMHHTTFPLTMHLSPEDTAHNKMQLTSTRKPLLQMRVPSENKHTRTACQLRDNCHTSS